MSLFPVFQTSGSALTVNRTWMDAISDNIANINTIRPFNEAAFQARYVVAQAVEGDGSSPGVGAGVRVAGVEFGDAQGRQRFEPDNPMADSRGVVRYPDIDLGDQMVQLIQAQRAYQLNLTVVERAKDSYQQAIQISAR